MSKKISSYQKLKNKIKELNEDIQNLRGKNGFQAELETEMRYQLEDDVSDLVWAGDSGKDIEGGLIKFFESVPELDPAEEARVIEELKKLKDGAPIIINVTNVSGGKIKWVSTGTED